MSSSLSASIAILLVAIVFLAGCAVEPTPTATQPPTPAQQPAPSIEPPSTFAVAPSPPGPVPAAVLTAPVPATPTSVPLTQPPLEPSQNPAPTALPVAMEQVSNPSFRLMEDQRTGQQSILIESSTAGATIRFTVDGRNPSPEIGTVYQAPISAPTTPHVKAIAFKKGLIQS
jgi:hypothetical protein